MVMAMIGKEKYQCITGENNMLLTEKQLRNIIRNLLAENQEKMYASKLAKLIGSGDLKSINQGIDLGESVGLIDRHYTDETDPYYTIAEKVIFYYLICHKELAAELRKEIESKPYGSDIFGFTGCNPGGTTVEYPDMPDFCKVSFRVRVPAPLRKN